MAVAVSGSDTAIGIVTLLRHPKYRPVYEIGYWLVPDARSQGFAGRAIRLTSRWAISLPEVERVEAHVDTRNTASLRTLSSAGFTQEGVLRRYLCFDDESADAAVLSVVK